MDNNVDELVVNDFGSEWTKFDYALVSKEELRKNFEQYFDIFPWHELDDSAVGFDMGCGTGRWAQFVADRVGSLNCIEPSDAIVVAKSKLASFENVRFFKETTETCSLPVKSQDFGYSLGVLHHIPNVSSALNDCAKLLKDGAPFLIYVYYNFENRPAWFKALWSVSDLLRQYISKLPAKSKQLVCNTLGYLIYWPLTRLARVADFLKIPGSRHIPLFHYRDKPFYQCLNDSLDRFGTRLEKRFSKGEIRLMLIEAGFVDITFSESEPYWCCVAYKSSSESC